MAKRPETPHADVLTLVTGHFHQGSGYDAWRERGTRDWLLIYTVGGKGRFGFEGGEIIAEPGDWVLLRRGTRHDYGVESSLKNWELVWSHFHPRAHWLPLLAWPSVHKGLMCVRIPDETTAKRAADRFLQAHQLAVGALPMRELLAMNALEETLIWCDQSLQQAQAGIDPRVREAMDFLIERLQEKLAIGDVADHVGLSVSRFAHLFKAETSQSPQQFLEGQRLDRAARLLQRTNFSIKQIAATVGFESPFYFSLRFKARTKLSPRQYRITQRASEA